MYITNYRSSLKITAYNNLQNIFSIVCFVLILCLYLPISKLKNMKAYNLNGTLYKTKDLAILANGTSIGIVEVEIDKYVPTVEGEVIFNVNAPKETVEIEIIIDEHYQTWYEAIQFKFDYKREGKYDFNNTFEPLFISGKFTFTDLSTGLIARTLLECCLLKDEWIEETGFCVECEGEGSYEVLDCHNSSNDCCGGCFKTVACSSCND